MKIKSRTKTAFVTNIMLAVITLGVFSLGFYGTDIAVSKTHGAYYSGSDETPYVTLMFNVYEGTEIVGKIMQEFEKRGLKTTFFVGGCWADDNGETLNAMVAAGFEIGSHGYFHKDHKRLSSEENKAEIINTEKVIKALCGYKPTLFAPPSGSFSQNTLKACNDLGYKTVMWSKDTIDWRDSDENLIFTRATEGLKNGDLILMHPKTHTLNVLPKILDEITARGFTPVTVTQNIGGFA